MIYFFAGIKNVLTFLAIKRIPELAVCHTLYAKPKRLIEFL
jgi:hypothetical protein